MRRRHRRLVDRAVVVDRGVVLGDAEQVQRLAGDVAIRARDLQLREAVESGEVVAVRVAHVRQREILHQERVLELGEQRRLVVAQLGLDVVLRVQEDLAVRLPHPVVLAPLPLVALRTAGEPREDPPGRRSRGIPVLAALEVHEHAVHVELHARRGARPRATCARSPPPSRRRGSSRTAGRGWRTASATGSSGSRRARRACARAGCPRRARACPTGSAGRGTWRGTRRARRRPRVRADRTWSPDQTRRPSGRGPRRSPRADRPARGSRASSARSSNGRPDRDRCGVSAATRASSVPSARASCASVASPRSR